MSNKRRNTSSPECDSPPKRQRSRATEPAASYDGMYDDPEAAVDERPQINASTGQTGAFPGLSVDEDVFYGPANDGIDYIRMVRSEAKGIPQLLRAQPEEHVPVEDCDEGEQDEGGYWDEDGTYTAKPNVHTDLSSTTLPKAQLQYYDSLLTQFTLVTATLKCVPPLSAIEKLTSSQPIFFPPENKNARITWGQRLKNRDPNPAQVACMDETSVFELLRLITIKMRGLFQDNRADAAKRLGAWIWAALGKCPARGELGSEEISDLRQLVQKALDVQEWLEKRSRSTHVSIENEEEDDEEENGAMAESDTIGDEIKAAKQRLALNADDSLRYNDVPSHGDTPAQHASREHIEVEVDKQAKLVVLDMILTVVGEAYGQRDLLEYRKVWNTNTV